MMERQVHSMNNLFAQLGQPSDDAAIAQFMETYRPLPSDVQLHEAAFWSSSQAGFPREAIGNDSDWGQVVEALNVELHARH